MPAKTPKKPSATNPLLAPWRTPFQAPPFAAIEPGHFKPAYAAAIKTHQAEIAAIAANTAKPTFKNTVLALENAGRQLNRVSGVFWNLTGANTSPAIQAIEREMAPRLAKHRNDITASARLFARLDAVHATRHELALDAEELRLVERLHLSFVRAGARLKGADRKRMAQIIQRLAALGTAFSQNVLADEQSFEMPLNAPGDLAGLPGFVIAAAAAAAVERGSMAAHVITLSRSLIEPFLTFSSRRDLREKAHAAWIRRGVSGGRTDNREIVTETLALRRERARLLGYNSFAAFKLDNTMAKTPAKVDELLGAVWNKALARAGEERRLLARRAAGDGLNGPLEPWDWRYYAEKIRQADYAIDEAEIKPYLPLDKMIEAAFYTATKLFGVVFKPRPDIAGYHADVRAFEVVTKGGDHVGLFLADYFARPSKRSGAWMSSYRTQERLAGEIRPIIVNVMNFAKTADGTPALLSFDDARTLFHEFGHGLHGLLSDVRFPSLSGTAVARDFVELPSQLFEHWLTTKEVLGRFAINIKTGKPMPAELIGKVMAARNFNQGFATVEFLGSAIVDMAFHSERYDGGDPLAFEAAILEAIGMPREIGMRHRTPHFSHVFSGDGYSAGYYSYMWSEVLDADAFDAFEEAGNVFSPAVARKLKKFVYAAGGTRPEDEAYLAFRGRLPSVDGLLRKRGLAA